MTDTQTPRTVDTVEFDDVKFNLRVAGGDVQQVAATLQSMILHAVAMSDAGTAMVSGITVMKPGWLDRTAYVVMVPLMILDVPAARWLRDAMAEAFALPASMWPVI